MQTISDSDIIRRIRFENPWWGENGAVRQQFREWQPRAYLDLFLPLLNESSVRRAIVLLGPRRVGKTVMIYHAIQKLLDGGVNPKTICYFSVDSPIYNTLSLERLMHFFSEATGTDVETCQVYVFFDEVQYLKNWEVHLKSLVDALPTMKAVASGSAAAALKLKSEESGAGRFTDFLLPPLTFYEYLELLGEGELVVAPATESQPVLTSSAGPTEKRTTEPTQEETQDETSELEASYPTSSNLVRLNELFIHYLNFGGYPEVIFSKEIQADPARFIKSDIIDKVLLRDLPSLYGISDIQELNALFTTLALNTADEVSLEKLAQTSGVAKNTLKRYIEYLEAAFLIKVVHRVDRSAKRFMRATNFKVYLTNPSMRAALFEPVEPDEPAVPYLTETAIFAQWFHSETRLYYARWNDGEVDMVTLGGTPGPIHWIVEVKWTDRYCQRPEELESLLAFCLGNGVKSTLVTSKTLFAVRRVGGVQFHFVPAALYCYTVGYNLIRNKSLFGRFATA